LKRQIRLPVWASYASMNPRHAELPARHAADDLVLHCKRRAAARIAELVVRHRDIPPHLAGSQIERDQMRVDASIEHDSPRIATPRDSPSRSRAAGPSE
jgi:hypothetical protein